jgi:hypothetical protein
MRGQIASAPQASLNHMFGILLGSEPFMKAWGTSQFEIVGQIFSGLLMLGRTA